MLIPAVGVTISARDVDCTCFVSGDLFMKFTFVIHIISNKSDRNLCQDKTSAGVLVFFPPLFGFECADETQTVIPSLSAWPRTGFYISLRQSCSEI